MPRLGAFLAVVLTLSGAAGPSAARPEREPRVFALLLNGGGSAAVNYHSHLVNLRSVVALLRARGVPDERIAVFSADGPDQAADLKIRDEPVEDEAWIIEGTRVWRALRPRTRYVDGKLDGMKMRPATRAALKRWFATDARSIRKGDTLLLYVTDHGTENKKDRANNNILLWNDELNVDGLEKLLRRLRPGVRVVSLMSQCYSGAFSRLMYGRRGRLPTGGHCGFYSTTEDRRAYGCYPDVRESDGLGHSHETVEALRYRADLEAAHLEVSLRDDTPDVPFRTSDRYLMDRLEEGRGRRAMAAFGDEWLRRAWQRKPDFEPEIRLVDRLAERFGTASPRSLAELERDRDALEQVRKKLGEYERLWVRVLDASRDEILGRLMEASPRWKERLDPKALGKLGDEERPARRRALAEAALRQARSEKGTVERLDALRKRAKASEEARYRLEVRLAALLRMRMVLLRAAGRAYLQEEGSGREREALSALLDCERAIPPSTDAVVTADPPLPPKALPPFDSDRQVLKAIWPSWLGISYRQPSKSMRERWDLPEGGTFVDRVFPGSPAEKAGIRGGDFVLGPKGSPRFREKHEVREWVMLASSSSPHTLELLRDGKTVEATLDLEPHPGALPKLPGPLPVGAEAPPLELQALRGTSPRIGQDGPVLLFYWATWCKPCKASVPAVMEAAHERGLKIVAITDEPGETIADFLKGWGRPFPEIVVSDEMRATFRGYGVTGTPTFIVVDEDGRIAARRVGYSKGKKLLTD